MLRYWSPSYKLDEYQPAAPARDRSANTSPQRKQGISYFVKMQYPLLALRAGNSNRLHKVLKSQHQKALATGSLVSSPEDAANF